MATLTTNDQAPVKANPAQKIMRIAAFIVALAITVAVAVARDQLAQMPLLTYPAVFIVSILGNASVLLPAPVFVVVFVAGQTMDPLAVGIIAGLGAAIGEMTGYLAGFSGQGLVENRPAYRRIQRWMNRSGVLVIFALAAIPNLFFDIGGIIAGAVRMPVWQFLLAAWAGKSLRLATVAYVATAFN